MSLKITIEGERGEGKTALTYLILQALADHNINAVTAESAHRDGDIHGGVVQQRRLESIRKQGAAVVIENVNISTKKPAA